MSSPKVGASGVHRTVPPHETLYRLVPLMERVGLTRVADLTGLDRIGIHTFGAVMPDTPDPLSVYNGKGPRRIDARVGAIMEAMERWSGLFLAPPLRHRTLRSCDRRVNVLDPRDLVLAIHEEWHPEACFATVDGWDLQREEPVEVPAQAAAIRFEGRFGVPCFPYTTTNGLASGNLLEEAVCHALCELIERDAWTLAEIRAHHLPRVMRSHGVALPALGEAPDADDADAWPNLDLSDAPSPIDRLVRRLERAGLKVRAKDITSDIGIATVFVALAEDIGIGGPLVHFGLGSHPDACVAIVRALTEVAQCRVTDIQGVREDLTASGGGAHPFAAHTRRVERIRDSSWYYRDSTTTVSWRELPHYENADVLEDVALLLRRLAAVGVERVIAVDLTHPHIGLPVARLLAPGLESWAADHGRLGQRAKAIWKRGQMTLLRETG